MRGKAQRIRLGIFIMISSAFLLLIFGWFTGKRLLEARDTYYVAYRDISVSGLEVGSPVKYLGINVGSVTDIRIDPKSVNTIIMQLSLESGIPVKEDAVADIIALGITGLKSIEIRGGTDEADLLEPESFIDSGSTLATDISGRAEVIAFKVEEVLNNLQTFTHPDNISSFTEAAEKISLLAENSNMTITRFDEMISENRQDIREATSAINSLASRLDNTSQDLAAGMEKLNEIMQGEDIAEVLGNLREISLSIRDANMKELIENLAEATLQTQSLLVRLDADFDESTRYLHENLVLLQHTLENINSAARKINTDPSVLIRGQSSRNTPDQNLR